MAKGRMLSKRISRSDKLAALPSDTERMFYSWLIPYLDVEGRLEADPDLLKADITPKLKHITPEKIEEVLVVLHNIGLIILYTVDKKEYLQLVKFEENQGTIRKDHEAPSNIPPPPTKRQPKDVVKTDKGGDNIIQSNSNINIIKSTANAPFILPTPEEIQESSDPKIKEYIENVCTKLYEEKIFLDVYAFKNKMAKNKKNGRGILHVLTRCYLSKPEEPWGFCQKIIAVEDLNYNERDYRKTT